MKTYLKRLSNGVDSGKPPTFPWFPMVSYGLLGDAFEVHLDIKNFSLSFSDNESTIKCMGVY